MTATNGWPSKPGWPLNPEKDGWHWVENKFTGDRRAALWLTDLHWGLRVPTHEMAEACIYLGPVLTPEEEAALQKRVAELEDFCEDYLVRFELFHITNTLEAPEDATGFLAEKARAILGAAPGGKDE